MRSVRPIKSDEWRGAGWIVTDEQLEDGRVICVRGVKRTSPPDDGYYYIEVTTYADKEQKWARAVEIVED